eukprot:11455513-Ditylum_brightwellii.AAC.1
MHDVVNDYTKNEEKEEEDIVLLLQIWGQEDSTPIGHIYNVMDYFNTLQVPKYSHHSNDS